jgi:hypothetical protein
MIVVSAIMNTTGKLEQIVVKQMPDAQLNAALTEALANWSFQPSAIDGKTVALRVLFGIRLAGH